MGVATAAAGGTGPGPTRTWPRAVPAAPPGRPAGSDHRAAAGHTVLSPEVPCMTPQPPALATPRPSTVSISCRRTADSVSPFCAATVLQEGFRLLRHPTPEQRLASHASDRGTTAAARLSCMAFDLVAHVSRNWRLLCDRPFCSVLEAQIRKRTASSSPPALSQESRYAHPPGGHKKGRRRRSVPSLPVRPQAPRPDPRAPN